MPRKTMSEADDAMTPSKKELLSNVIESETRAVDLSGSCSANTVLRVADSRRVETGGG